MIGNLKALGLALVAVFAVAAVTASVASAAPGTLTSDGPVKLTGTSIAGMATGFGFKVECHEHATVGEVGKAPGFITPPLSTFTVQIESTGCIATLGAIEAPATVTTNGCDGVTHIGETIEAEKWSGTSDIVCPVGKEIEIHAYTNASHTSSICTVKIPAQSGLTGGYVENIGNGDVLLSGLGGGIKATKTGILCGGSAETENAELHGNAVVSGTNEKGAPTDIAISD